jgi:hypothetical protein
VGAATLAAALTASIATTPEAEVVFYWHISAVCCGATSRLLSEFKRT